MGKLTARQVATAKGPKRLGDGDNLYLEISPTGSKRWLVRYSRCAGRVTEKTLGSASFLSLADARTAAYDFRRNLTLGVTAPKHVTFGALANELLIAKGAREKPKTTQLKLKFLSYCEPILNRDISRVRLEDVVAVLAPLWNTKPASADRCRAIMETTFDAARIKGLRSGENPARWRGNLSHVLSRRPILPRGHQRALPYAAVPDLMRRLEDEGGVVARALRLTILCALRKGEVLELRWGHVEGSMLVIPAENTKMRREFRVPLSSGALAVLEEQRAFGANGFIFPSPLRANRPLSATAFNEILRRLKIDGTPHGIARSSFRDWAGDCTTHDRDTAEQALAHSLGGVEGAYRRGDAFEKRKRLMEDWSIFLA
jgi:integrase